MADFSNGWTKTILSGGNPVSLAGSQSLPAISAADGKHSIICLSHQLRVYFLQTRSCVRTCDVDLSQAVDIQLDPCSDNQIVVFTASEILYVNWREKVETPIVARQTITPSLDGLQSIFKVSASRYLAVAEYDSLLSIYSIDRETAVATKQLEFDAVRAFATSANGHKLAVVRDSGDVNLYDLSAAVSDSNIAPDLASVQAAVTATKETFSAQRKQVTCVAVSDSGIIALGVSTGAIVLLYGGSSTGKPQRVLRWHIDPAESLCFSADEVYLVSGGHEKVLVFWHLDSDRTQFLPRLAGPIDGISVDKHRPDHYTVSLRVAEVKGQQTTHDIVTISAVDLISRLSVSPARPNFAVSQRRAVDAARRKHTSDPRTVQHDVTASMVVHPTSRHLYFARGAAIQAYDVVRGEQAFVQHVVPQIPTGKVRSERTLEDPTVSQLAFTEDGLWMATFDSMPTSDFDDLMSRNDVAHALKFWQWKDSEWSLSSKIVDPHGAGIEIGSIVTPGGHAFTTIDKYGGIRVWRPRANHVGALVGGTGLATQTVWTLRRARAPTATLSSVSACYSPDRSLLAVSHGAVVKVHDPESLHAADFRVPSMESPVKALSIIDTCLVVASERKLISYDLVSASESELCAQMGTPGIANLFAVDAGKQLVAVAVNSYHSEPELSLRGKIVIFRTDSHTPIHTSQHSSAIASLTYTPSGFIFVDTDSRIGLVAPEIKQALSGTATDDLSSQMSQMLVSAQATANVLFARAAAADFNSTSETAEDADKWTAHKAIDVATLQPIFSNIEGVTLDSLFERVVRAVQ